MKDTGSTAEELSGAGYYTGNTGEDEVGLWHMEGGAEGIK